MKTDSLFYRLFQEWPELVLELAGLEATTTGYTLRAEEIKQTGFRLDGVLVPPDDRPDWPLVFVETQFQRDSDFHARWFSELFLYLYRRPPRRAWRAVTVFPNRAAEGAVEAAYERLLADPWVKRVYLEEALREPTPSRGVRVLGLILAPPEVVVAEAKALLAEKSAANEGLTGVALVDWVETLLVYKLPRLSREEIRKMLDIFNVELKQTRFYQEVFAEGLEEGHKEGRQEGRQEGQRQERLRIARSLLEVIADDRLLAEKTGLSEAEVRGLREEEG
ncbi:MAG: Rpn family recombination-promoting nuclease/putative transposase [Candidatus Competibacter sp.]|nr:Rpn family recombination-promoting nuclease/putative transposase [Candidatus Competibacter sp.]